MIPEEWKGISGVGGYETGSTSDVAGLYDGISPRAQTAFALHRFQLDLLVSQIKMIFYHLRKKSNGVIWSADVDQS